MHAEPAQLVERYRDLIGLETARDDCHRFEIRQAAKSLRDRWKEWQGEDFPARDDFRGACRVTTEPISNDDGAEDSRPSGLLALLNVKWLIVIAIVYVLSIMPAYVAVLLLQSRGIDPYLAFEIFYGPILWIIDNVGWARRLDSLIEPVLRQLAGR
jgi:hypothetical protein